METLLEFFRVVSNPLPSPPRPRPPTAPTLTFSTPGAPVGSTSNSFSDRHKAPGRLGLDVPDDDVHAYISGPAIVIDAIAFY
ncbi:hypothetical protein AB0D62_38215 [Streptomyces massasporeus]|uniref:hypothetical protein n=1 Tax=Streptomyces massasporeus TaxID=67324 RepID=UPI0033EAEBB0